MDCSNDYIYPSGARIWDDMVSGREYDATHPFLLERLNATKDKIWKYNNMRPSMLKERNKLLRGLLGRSDEDSFINQPFFCDYGCNTRVGAHFYAGYDCAFLDCGKITIGDHVMLGPKVALYAVNHPMDPTVRDTGLEYGVPITIGSHVWIGGSTTVCPGVTIGDNVVIGAGSVVVHDIPDNCLAVGNPARVVRYFGEADRRYWEEELRLYRELADEAIV